MDGVPARRLRLRDNMTGQGLILATLGLLSLGVVMVYSTYGAMRGAAHWYERGDAREAVFAAAAVLVLLLVGRMDYHVLARSPWPNNRLLRHITPASVLLFIGFVTSAILFIPGVGYSVGGRVRWIRFGAFSFQPPDLLKLALVIWLAVYLSKPGRKEKSFWRTFVPCMIVLGMAEILVATQDFSNAALIGLAATGLLFMAGVRWWFFLLLIPLVAGGFYKEVVKVPARWSRITAFAHPYDTSDSNAYQTRQALIATGSGANPAGLGGGMSKRGYLPECSTDFVYSVVCEEAGLPGAGLVIGLLLVWLLLCRRAGIHADDRLGALLAAGLGFSIILQAVLHIAVNLAVFPTTGQPLPFVSSGGTALLTNAAATAVILSVTAYGRAGAPAAVPQVAAA